MRSPSAQKFPGGSQELFGTKEGFSRVPTEEPPGISGEIALKEYIFAKDPQVKLCIFAVAPPTGSVD